MQKCIRCSIPNVVFFSSLAIMGRECRKNTFKLLNDTYSTDNEALGTLFQLSKSACSETGL